MAWFKVDDGFPTHRKVLSIPRGQRRLAAVGAWTLAGAWSSANGTEGAIPGHVVEELGITPRVVSDLLASGLWRSDNDSKQMHDFLDYNPSAAQVSADREAARLRQKRAREAARERRAEEARQPPLEILR